MQPTDHREQPMFTLITGGTVYTPDKLGRRDILIAGRVIAGIAEKIDVRRIQTACHPNHG